MYKYLISLILLFAFACNSSVEKVAQVKENLSEKKEKNVVVAANDSLLQPQKMLRTTMGLQVPVYGFEGFEAAILKRKEENTTYIVNFWATWCGPCVAELPHFLELEKRYKGKNVKFIFVSLDFINNLETTLVPFLDKRKIDSEMVVLNQKNVDVWMEKIDKKWSGAIPATLIYNAKGRKFIEDKFDTVDELEKVLIPML